jgi:hypothetical protein
VIEWVSAMCGMPVRVRPPQHPVCHKSVTSSASRGAKTSELLRWS